MYQLNVADTAQTLVATRNCFINLFAEGLLTHQYISKSKESYSFYCKVWCLNSAATRGTSFIITNGIRDFHQNSLDSELDSYNLKNSIELIELIT